ncbi:MAG: hypothetical protein IH780_00115 [Thaumarchaeota archaeon]|jgi:hypothetical protein|nr:hypothetical protein [Nitrososphaerota archaeon]
MIRIPKTIRFIRKPDHITFLIGLGLILIATVLQSFEIKLVSTIFFIFTLGYEIYEISSRETDIWQVDHVTFVIGIAILLFSFWYESLWLLILVDVLMCFTFGWEVYRIRKKDLENKKRRMQQ